MKGKVKVWRQGDISIRQIDKPRGEIVAHDGILARGEATGHAHRLIAGPESQVRYFRDERVNQFEVLTGYADLIHEGHFTHRFGVGSYEWDRQREADWINEVTRNVED